MGVSLITAVLRFEERAIGGAYFEHEQIEAGLPAFLPRWPYQVGLLQHNGSRCYWSWTVWEFNYRPRR
jgi:hypothetical protein